MKPVRWLIAGILFAPLMGIAQSPAVNLPIDRLLLYGMMTQIGTTAMGEKFDPEGRREYTVYFSGGDHTSFKSEDSRGISDGRIAEEVKKLRRQSVHRYVYDEHDRIIRVEHRGPGDQPGRYAKMSFRDGETHWWKQDWIEMGGIRRYQIRREERRSTCHIYFGLSGEHVMGYRGKFPEDLSWKWGWGEEVNGFACGIGLTTERGALEDIAFAVMVANRTESGMSIYYGYRPILESESGTVISAKHLPMKIGGLWGRPGQTEGIGSKMDYRKGSYLSAGGGEQCEHNEKLIDWYPDLPPGKYVLRVIRKNPRKESPDLKSARVSLEVTEKKFE